MSFILKINNIDRTIYVDKSSFALTQVANDEVDELRFTLILSSSDMATIKPDISSKVEFFDGSDKLFGGYIRKINEGNINYKLFGIECTCFDYSFDLGSKVVVDNYQDKSLLYVLNTLINNYANTEQKIIDSMESGWSAGSADTTNFVEGEQSLKISNTTANKSIALNLETFSNNVVSDSDDYIDFWYYVEDSSNLTSVSLKLGDSAFTNYYLETISSGFSDGWNYSHIQKSDFTLTGTLDWDSIAKVEVGSVGTSDVSFDDIRMISEDSFYKSGIEKDGVNVDFISWNYEPLNQVIKQLADLVGYYWYIDSDKNVKFFSAGFELTTFDIEDDNGNMLQNSLKIMNDGTQIKNAIYVRGGEYLATNLAEEKHLGDGEMRNWKLNNNGKTLKVYVDSGSGYVEKTVGIENLNEDDGSYDWFWNNSEKYIKQADFGSPATLSNTDKLKITYYPYLPVLTYIEDGGSITTHGKQEIAIIDNTIKSKEGARQRALAELDAFKNSLANNKVQTYTAGARAGQQIQINSVIRNLNEYFIIWRLKVIIKNDDSLQYSLDLIDKKKLTLTNTLIQLLLAKYKSIKIADDEILDKLSVHNENVVIQENHIITVEGFTKNYGADANAGKYNQCQYA